ncbi:hypothetical protein ACQKC9_02195 [Psychrobacter sp. NPDC078409]|uniref:hypothetical protein n=1 Tax=unclassified Psychrobacter TaxID=196806 RepID=UPI00070E9178|nr:hypothetical protein [Psychrobacter sp. P11G3]KRG35427.1 hypothetical protein AK824_08595 [Psychrobacter sp. P11G3]
MSILSIRIFLFILVLIGIFIIFKAIKLFSNAFNGIILLTLPYNDNAGSFTVSKSGIYAIWHKGPLFKKTPLTQFRTHILNTATDKEIKLNRSILSPRSNNFDTGRMELFTFKAEAGHYELKLVPGSSTSRFQAMIGGAIPLADIDLNHYSIEIQKSQAQILTILAIPLLLLGIAGIVGGLVVGLLAEKIFI